MAEQQQQQAREESDESDEAVSDETESSCWPAIGDSDDEPPPLV